MLQIVLLRHGKTQGNLERKYVGVTDEPLCQQGIDEIKHHRNDYMPHPQAVYVSPLKRCRQTTDILFPNHPVCVVNGISECDFGRFEGKNHVDLSNDLEYEKFVTNQGTTEFPGGEHPKLFKKRCQEEFLYIVEDMQDKGVENGVIICHGGTIMAIMERFCVPKQDFFDYQVRNGRGYLIGSTNQGKSFVLLREIG